MRLSLDIGLGSVATMGGGIPSELHYEGDSYVIGHATAPATGRWGVDNPDVTNTAVGGSSIEEIRDRIIASGLRRNTTVIWNGGNENTSIGQATGVYQEIFDWLGHERVLIIPEATLFNKTSGENAIAVGVRDWLATNHPGKLLDWRDYFMVSDGSTDGDADVAAGLMPRYRLKADGVHVLPDYMATFYNDHMYAELVSRGWAQEFTPAVGNLIPDGGFDLGTEIDEVGAGWSVTGGKLVGVPDAATSTVAWVVGIAAGTYLVEWDVTDYTAGNLTPRFTIGTTVVGTAVNANGHASQEMVSAGNGRFAISKSAGFNGKIDNVSVVRTA